MNGNTTDRLIIAVVVTALGAGALIVALNVFRPGDNAGTINIIMNLVGPALTVLYMMLRSDRTERKVEEVKKEARQVAEVAAEGVKTAKESVLKAAATQATAAEAAAQVIEKVDEIRGMVNGRQEAMQRRIAELEEELRRRQKGG